MLHVFDLPNISIIIGEGGSGGAIALASSNKVIMLENSIYSVISPEGCASILWKSPENAHLAAEAMCITAENLQKLKLIDELISEPLGGAHRNIAPVSEAISSSILISNRLIFFTVFKLKVSFFMRSNLYCKFFLAYL